MKPIHPFPARMAPDIALDAVSDLNKNAVVLDPMTGSGTVIRQAVLHGLTAYGCDLDPLAVLMSKVGTKKINVKKVMEVGYQILEEAKDSKLKDIKLPWMDNDEETIAFVDFWFAKPQRNDLRKISFYLLEYERGGVDKNIIDALRIALSRTIITKKVGASLAWDISHSRPHKVRTENDYDVFSGFQKSFEKLASQLVLNEQSGKAQIYNADARNLKKIKDGSIDAVITSPPYLNAIDYMRGHKFALIWFGYKISDLRKIRTTSIGAEKGIKDITQDIVKIRKKIINDNALPDSQIRMIERYIGDAILLMSEIARVLKNKGKAILVIGNSSLKGQYIENSAIFELAGHLSGLSLVSTQTRELPSNSRYLPMPKEGDNSLSKRMRYEVVQTYAH